VDHRGLIPFVHTSRYTHKCILHSIRAVRMQVKASWMKRHHCVLHFAGMIKRLEVFQFWRRAPTSPISQCPTCVYHACHAVSRSSGPTPDLLTVCSEFGNSQFFIARPLLLAFTDVCAERKVGKNFIHLFHYLLDCTEPPSTGRGYDASHNTRTRFLPAPSLEPPAERERPRLVPGPIVSLRIDSRAISRVDQTAILPSLNVNLVCFVLVSPSH